MKKPSGSSSLHDRWISASPSPVETPGSGSAEIVAELSWLNCSTAAEAALVEIVTTELNGTIAPGRGADEELAERLGIVAEVGCGTWVMMS